MVFAYMAAGLVVVFLLVMLAAVGFDKGFKSRNFIVFEIVVAMIMLAILALFWIGALNDWGKGEDVMLTITPH
jgi:hypothetical protein